MADHRTRRVSGASADAVTDRPASGGSAARRSRGRFAGSGDERQACHARVADDTAMARAAAEPAVSCRRLGSVGRDRSALGCFRSRRRCPNPADRRRRRPALLELRSVTFRDGSILSPLRVPPRLLTRPRSVRRPRRSPPQRASAHGSRPQRPAAAYTRHRARPARRRSPRASRTRNSHRGFAGRRS